MNPDRHLNAHMRMFRHLVEGDGESASAQRRFYDEYLSVMDVPADYYLLTPTLSGGYIHDQSEPFNYTWAPAQTYPSAIFSTSISGTLAASGESGFAGALPWDDGDHTYQPSELLLLDPGPVSFGLTSFVEGRYFGLPFSAIQTCQSDSVLSTSALFTLE